MDHRPARSLLLLPSPVAEDLLRLAHDWVAAWVADPFLVVVLGDGSVGSGPTTPDVTALVIGRDGSVSVDLLDELGERPTDLLRVIGISLDEGLLGADGSTIREEAIRVERMLQRAASTHNQIRSINLIVAETAASALDSGRLVVPKWDVNVLASAENRTGLRAFDAFVRRSRRKDLDGFVLAHALTLGGLWSGMAAAPYDEANPRRATDGVDLQRVSVRGVLAQDFMVQMAQRGLELLAQEDTPLRDPTIRSQLSGERDRERLTPIADERVDEAVALLSVFVLDGVDGKPLRYRQLAMTSFALSKAGAWESVKGFGRFSFDKVRQLPTWATYRVRSSLQRRTGRALHGEDGEALIETAQDRFGDAAEFEKDITSLLALREEGRQALARPPAVTAAGPDTYAHLWRSMRQAAFRMLDGGSVQDPDALESVLVSRKLSGTLPSGSLVCPDAREPWSPHDEVVALVEAATRDLPLTVGWLDVTEAGRWADVLEALAATYDERVGAVESARALVDEELAQVAEEAIRCEHELAAADALLALDEHDQGPILAARIDAALAGIDASIRSMLILPAVAEIPVSIMAALDVEQASTGDGDGGGDTHGDVDADGDIEVDDATVAEPPLPAAVVSHPPVAPAAAFDRDAAVGWRTNLIQELERAEQRRTRLLEQAEELVSERLLLEQVQPIVTDDLLALRAWRWRLERSFAGMLVHQLESERQKLDADYKSVEDALHRDMPQLEPKQDLYGRFVRHLSIAFLISALLARLLWKPILDRVGVEHGEGSAVVAGYLGVPGYPFAALFLMLTLLALVSYHRRWSRARIALQIIRHELQQIPRMVEHLQRERLRTFELSRQAREMLRLLSEVIHRPFLLDGIGDALPSSRSLDPEDLPKIVRFARPQVDDGWPGEVRFIQRILKSQLRPGWRSDAYSRLLAAVQVQHGVVRGELDAQRADRDPVIRTAVVEHLLLDEAQRAAGVARIREVLDDILGWSVAQDFPYPEVRVVRVERDPLDVRTDMFDDGRDESEDWYDFLRGDVAADERWSPATFSAGHRREYLERRNRIVHAPPRFHTAAGPTATTVPPRPDEVRPVEMAVRIDVLPETVPTSRVGVFSVARTDDEDDQGPPDRGRDAVVRDDVAAEDGSDGLTSAKDGGAFIF